MAIPSNDELSVAADLLEQENFPEVAAFLRGVTTGAVIAADADDLSRFVATQAALVPAAQILNDIDWNVHGLTAVVPASLVTPPGPQNPTITVTEPHP